MGHCALRSERHQKRWFKLFSNAFSSRRADPKQSSNQRSSSGNRVAGLRPHVCSSAHDSGLSSSTRTNLEVFNFSGKRLFINQLQAIYGENNRGSGRGHTE